MSLLATTEVSADPCDDQIGKVIAAEGGSIRYGRSAESPIDLKGQEVPVCLNSVVSITGVGRVTIELSDPAAKKANNDRPIVTLGPNSSLSFKKPPQDRSWVLELVEGWFRFFSPRPTNIDVETRFVTAGVRGTEFVLHSQNNACRETGEKVGCAVLWVQQGRVLASNGTDSVEVDAQGPQSARTVVARLGQPLEVRALRITPEDAVDWVVHYLPLSQLRPPRCDASADGPAAVDVRMAIGCGSPAAVLGALQRIPSSASAVARAELYGLAAARLLTAGDAKQAEDLLGRAIALSVNASFYAMKSVIALKQNDRWAARAAAEQALVVDSGSPDALLAMSYVRQAEFDLPGARGAAQTAADSSEHDPLLAARLAELDLALGDTSTALKAAQRAVTEALGESVWTEESLEACGFEGGTPANARDAVLSRTYTVLGFTRLIRLEVAAAQGNMQSAICVDDQAPLARLGLGLALIRQGKLDQGVRQLEIAVALDPKVSLYRSYLGKGYFEQDEFELAEKEFSQAKAYDENDPTPWLYGAILKQVLNQPADALDEMQKSIALSDKRAPYRSDVGLHEDMAARQIGLARIYDDLGFNRLATLEASRALASNPADYAAHRFLADSYRDEPRLEIARASQLLQAQLLQPLNLNPIQPSLAFTDLGIRSIAGPANAGFNEYSSLFIRDGTNLYATGLLGSDNTNAEEVVVSGMSGRAAFSAGVFHYETDGFRKDADLKHDIYNLYGQLSLSEQLDVQLEYRHRETDSGDRRFDVTPFGSFDAERRDRDQDILRFGAHFSVSPNADIIVSYIDSQYDEKVELDRPSPVPDFDYKTNVDSDQYEIQYLFSTESLNFIFGAGSYDTDAKIKELFFSSDIDSWNAYAYGIYRHGPSLDLTLGIGYEDYDNDSLSNGLSFNEVTPKFGINWRPLTWMTFRAAAYKGVKHVLAANQTIEPTIIAGFNQLFDEFDGSVVDSYNAAVDLSGEDLFLGLAVGRRESKLHYAVGTTEYDESIAQFYANWFPFKQVPVSAEIIASHFEQDDQPILPLDIKMIRIPVEVRYVRPDGLFAGAGVTYFKQKVEMDTGFGSTDVEKDSA
ncbi:MAG: TonB-dependent receptor, partial [Sedimenticolaceae bacterium]